MVTAKKGFGVEFRQGDGFKGEFGFLGLKTKRKEKVREKERELGGLGLVAVSVYYVQYLVSEMNL